MACRSAAVTDNLVTWLNAGTWPLTGWTAERKWVPVERMEDMAAAPLVEVVPPPSGKVISLTRGLKVVDHAIAICVSQRYPTGGDVPNEWIDDRVELVEAIMRSLPEVEFTGQPTGYQVRVRDDAESRPEATYLDAEDMDGKRIFLAVITVTLRESFPAVIPTPQDPLLIGLRCWLRANGIDHSGGGRDFSAVGSPGLMLGLDGISQSAMSFPIPGSDYYRRATFPVPSGDFSITLFAWANRGATGTNVVFGNDANDIRLGFDLAGSFFTAGGTVTWVGGGVPIDFGWLSYTGVKRGSSLKLYTGATLRAENALGANYTVASPAWIGKSALDIGGAEYIGIYSRALSDGGVAVGSPAVAGSDIDRLHGGVGYFDPTDV